MNLSLVMMDLWHDKSFSSSFDCDPSIFDIEFHDISELWDNSMGDLELLDAVNYVEKYSPIVEDISIEDETLFSDVEQIDSKYVVYFVDVMKYFCSTFSELQCCVVMFMLNYCYNFVLEWLVARMFSIFSLMNKEICLCISLVVYFLELLLKLNQVLK